LLPRDRVHDPFGSRTGLDFKIVPNKTGVGYYYYYYYELLNNTRAFRENRTDFQRATTVQRFTHVYTRPAHAHAYAPFLRRCENAVGDFVFYDRWLLFFNVPETIRECLRGRGRFLMLRKNCPKPRYRTHVYTYTYISPPPPPSSSSSGRNAIIVLWNDGLSFARWLGNLSRDGRR